MFAYLDVSVMSYSLFKNCGSFGGGNETLATAFENQFVVASSVAINQGPGFVDCTIDLWKASTIPTGMRTPKSQLHDLT